jgi:hypothetical protein
VYRVQMGFSVLLDGRVWSTPYRLPHVHTVLEHTAGDSTHFLRPDPLGLGVPSKG